MYPKRSNPSQHILCPIFPYLFKHELLHHMPALPQTRTITRNLKQYTEPCTCWALTLQHPSPNWFPPLYSYLPYSQLHPFTTITRPDNKTIMRTPPTHSPDTRSGLCLPLRALLQKNVATPNAKSAVMHTYQQTQVHKPIKKTTISKSISTPKTQPVHSMSCLKKNGSQNMSSSGLVDWLFSNHR